MARVVALVAACAAFVGCGAGADAPDEPHRARLPNIVLITLDTTRFDHLSAYGYDKPTSPNLAALASESVVYTNCISTASATLPAHASLFTGKFTTSHGARRDPEGPLRLSQALDEPRYETNRARGLADDEITLPMLLKTRGYATGGVVGGPWMKRVFGWARGFDFYDDSKITRLNGRPADSVTMTALEWIEARNGEPFFLFLNYFDPHGPLVPPREYVTPFLPAGAQLPGDYDALRATQTTILDPQHPMELFKVLYDGEIRYMDEWLGRLFERLKRMGVYDDTWIIVTADHGELIGEHDQYGHGKFLFQEEIHVPLLMKYPRGRAEPGRVDRFVQSVDVLPAVCDELAIPIPGGVQGQVPAEVSHPIISETYPLPYLAPAGSWQSIIDGHLKFHWNSNGDHQLFDLSKDPQESVNLLTADRQAAAPLMARLSEYLAGLPRPGDATARDVDDETIKSLRSLGYID